MNRNLVLANAILWAAALVSSAIVGAPPLLTFGLLPALFAGSLIINRRGA